MGDVVRGPGFGKEPIEQTAPEPERPSTRPADGRWHRRDGNGNLWVWLDYPIAGTENWSSTPVIEAVAPIWHHDKAGTLVQGTKPNPARITLALDSRGMDGPEVDEALGLMGNTIVDAWEAGEAEPTEVEVRRLATLTSYPPAFFYRDDPPVMGPIFLCARGRRQSGDRGGNGRPDYAGRRVHYGVADGDVTVPVCGTRPKGALPALAGDWEDVTCLRCVAWRGDYAETATSED